MTCHVVHLVCDILKPILCAFDSSDHRSKLASDNRLGMERLTKSLSLGSPSNGWSFRNYITMSSQIDDILEAFFHNKALTSHGWANHDPAFVVEITVSRHGGWVRGLCGTRRRGRTAPKHDENPPALRPKGIPHRDFNIVEGDKCCSSSWRLKTIGIRKQLSKISKADVHSLSW